tara:strand:- start:868 stop:1098 length:231 start_codon:yes stop_codon:yes gene_type:complete
MVIKTSPKRKREILNAQLKDERKNFAKQNAKLGYSKADKRRRERNNQELKMRLDLKKARFEKDRVETKYKDWRMKN